MKVTLNRYSLGLGVSVVAFALAVALFVAAQSNLFLIPYPVVSPEAPAAVAESPQPS